MTNQKINPWYGMPAHNQRRVKESASHDIYWITDHTCRYGFYIHSDSAFLDVGTHTNLKGVTIIKHNNEPEKSGELFLVLNNNQDWEIFHTLCCDLVAIANQHENNAEMIHAVEIRLMRWQELLRQTRKMDMSLIGQMGLFSELLCLRDIVSPYTGIEQAIVSWVGGDHDKQDFLIDCAVIEVKSYRTSKGAFAHISSPQQLVSDKIPLFLLTYGLTETDTGDSIMDIVESINGQLSDVSLNVKTRFENKLIEYGYIPEVTKADWHKFIVDKRRAYLVGDDFPKISPSLIDNRIVNVKYSIDLLQCGDSECNAETFLKEL